MAREISKEVKDWSQGRHLAAELARHTVTGVLIDNEAARYTLRWRAYTVGSRIWDRLLNWESRSEVEIRDAAKKLRKIIDLDNEALRQDGESRVNLNYFMESGNLITEIDWISDVHDLGDPGSNDFLILCDKVGLSGWQPWEITYLLALRMIDDAIRYHGEGQNDLAETLVLKALDETYVTEIIADGKHRNSDYLFFKTDRLLADKEFEIKAKAVKSKAARNAADVRHKENRALKSEVISYYKEHLNEFKSMDKAAQVIVSLKLVPVTFRTVRDWIAEHRKQLRSARKP